MLFLFSKMSKSSHKKSKEKKQQHPPEQPVKSILFHLSKRDWILGFFLFLFTLVVYQPAWNGKPIWDDDQHITRPDLRSINGLSRIWTELGATQQYYPLMHSVFWIEYHLWGDSNLGYHLVNIFLHFLSALLLIFILRRLAIPSAWFVAAIFALHPIQVESVAWITELKNTLSGVFFFATILAYLKFDSERKRNFYAIAICFFILGLASKSVIATLPVSLLVAFWWKRGKINWKNDVVPLLPFFMLGIAYGLFTAWVERKYIGAQGGEYSFSIIERCLIAGRAIWFYLGKIILPVNLIFIYPRWNVSQAVWWQYLFPVATLVLAGVLWALRNRSRAPIAAFLFFTATLFPVLGFFNVYPFRYSFVADHFQYLACIGPIVLLVFGIEWAFGFLRGNLRRFLRPIIFLIILFTLAAWTWSQSGMYADAEVLYKITIKKNPACWMAYDNLGVIMAISNRSDEAIFLYKKAAEIKPDDPESYNNLGEILFKTGRIEDAKANLQRALDINPKYPEAHNNLGTLLEKGGLINEAIDHYRKALEFNSNLSDAHKNLGTLLAKTGQTDEARIHLLRALQINPNNDQAHNSLGILLESIGQTVEAITHYRKALEINPINSEAHYNLGNALFQIGHPDEAIAQFKMALEITPNYSDVHNNLGNALFQTGHPDEAIAQFKMALEITPDKISTLKNLAISYVRTGKLTDAIPLVEKALALAKSSGDESMIKEITANLDRLNKMIHSGHQSPQ
jgi:Tfp pilus assembly protein PilF